MVCILMRSSKVLLALRNSAVRSYCIVPFLIFWTTSCYPSDFSEEHTTKQRYQHTDAFNNTSEPLNEGPAAIELSSSSQLSSSYSLLARCLWAVSEWRHANPGSLFLPSHCTVSYSQPDALQWCSFMSSSPYGIDWNSHPFRYTCLIVCYSNEFRA